MKPVGYWLLAGFAGLLFFAANVPGEPAPPPVHFERDIQPILVRCVQCHGPSKAKAGLRLDRREEAIAALKSGMHAVVPGKPETSELLRRVGPQAEKRMPPTGEALTASQIEKLRRWIAGGADWPAHWAYRPLTKATPRTAQSDWARTPIDLFILDKLDEHGLLPASPANQRTLLRRVYFDLIGLPPTPAELDAFLADARPDAYERVVDRLLASPHYGERWARHWLDVVHYAETHGHDQDRPRDHAWPYRDYLIRAFNQDKPYDRFVQEQVAGDVLFSEDAEAIVATGMLAAGPWDESSLRDIREDSIDREIGRYLDRDDIVTTVMATFVSTTVHCARCHDHKFDPIPQTEYYGLQAVFAGIDKGNRTYDADPQVAARRKQLAERKAQLAKDRQDMAATLLAPALQGKVAEWEKTIAAAASPWQPLEAADLKSAEGVTLVRQLDRSVLSQGKRPEKDTYTVVAHTDVPAITGILLEVLTDDSLPQKGPGRQDNGNFHLNEFTVTAAPRDNPSAGSTLAWKAVEADFNQQGWTIAHAIDKNPATAWGIYPQVGKPHRAVFTLKEPLRTAGSTLTFTLEQSHGREHLIGRFRLSVTAAAMPGQSLVPAPIAAILPVAASQRTDRQRADLAAYYLEQQIDQEIAKLPKPAQVYCGTNQFAVDGSFKPTAAPRPVHVLQRGDVRNPKGLAESAALSCISGLEHRFALANPGEEGSRRAALARWLSDRRNGLAWRSIANRVWQYHFGRGLVDTPNDFGLMGSAPTHPELLDWLALYLQENGGSLKKLHRLIVTSAVYRQSTQHEPRFAGIDADNRFLWRMNRQRLDAESIRDAVLLISGKLDAKMGGPSVKQFIQTPGIHVTPNVDYQNFNVDDPANYRRSVYRFVFRTLPDPFLEALDCPDGSQAMPVRSASVTPLQALALLNDKFMVRQSEHVAERIGRSAAAGDEQIAAMFRLILGRTPSEKEVEGFRVYVGRHGMANACRLLLNSNEFVFVD